MPDEVFVAGFERRELVELAVLRPSRNGNELAGPDLARLKWVVKMRVACSQRLDRFGATKLAFAS